MAYDAPPDDTSEPGGAEEPADAEEREQDVELPSLDTVAGWYEDWEETTREDRELSQRDYDYYDNEQWTSEEVAELERRGQPVLTKNRIARKVNFILGDEAEKPVDPIARPKTPQHEDDARAATDALRATEEGQEFDTVRSAVFKDILIAGWGGSLIGGDPDPNAVTCAPLTQVSWRRLWWDPFSALPDYSDAAYKGIDLWMDLADAQAEYPDAADALAAIVNKNPSGGALNDDKPTLWTDRGRSRVKVCEVYFKRGGDYYKACFNGDLDDWLEKPRLTGVLDERQKHHICPLEMMSCYVRDRDNARYGIVRSLISPQDEVNKRDSKSLHLLSVQGVIAEEGAILDPQDFMQKLAMPDGLSVAAPGALSDPGGARLQVRDGSQLAAAHMQMSQQARADLDGIGPSSAGLPDLPNTASGKAFAYRQKSAAKEMAPVFANLHRWDLAVMRQNWMRICQYRTEEWWLRVTDDQELTGYRFVALNQHMTRAERFKQLLDKGVPPPKALSTAAGNFASEIMRQVQQYMQGAQKLAAQQGVQAPPDPTQAILAHPLMQEEVTLNQAAKMGVDIMIDMQPDTAILEDEEFQAVTDVLPAIAPLVPELAKPLVKVMFKASHFQSKNEILRELDKAPDPKAQQEQQQAHAIQLAGAKAGVAVQQSQAKLNEARAAQAAAQAQTEVPTAQADIEAKKAGAMHDAAQAGFKAGGG